MLETQSDVTLDIIMSGASERGISFGAKFDNIRRR